MPAQSAIVVVVDGLGAGWIGPYGNTWVETPCFNQLAAQSAIAETVIADSPDLLSAYRAYWSGRHALACALPSDHSLPALAATSGLQSLLITDEPEVASQPLAARFTRQKVLEPLSPRACAAKVEKTSLFHLFDAAVQTLADCVQPSLIWIHSRGMMGPWDAPLDLRNQFADEDDPPPPAFVDPPARVLSPNFDPDELLGITQAYAGQVVSLDLCLEMLLETFDAHPLFQNALFAVTSPRGYPLGEHLQVGHGQCALYGESLHVPLFLRLPNREGALMRLRGISQPHELYTTIAKTCDWNPPISPLPPGILAELKSRGDSASAAYSAAPGQRSIRTPAWFLRESIRNDEAHYELFAKPDDRWEANEISGRCAPVVELLAARMNEFASSASQDPPAELPPLAELLCDSWR